MTHKFITANQPELVTLARGFTLGADALALVILVLGVLFVAVIPTNKVKVAAAGVLSFALLTTSALFQVTEVGTYIRGDGYEVDYVRPIMQLVTYGVTGFMLVSFVHARPGRGTEFFVLAMMLLSALLQGAATLSTEFRPGLFIGLSALPFLAGYITLIKDSRMRAGPEESVATRWGPWLVLAAFGLHWVLFVLFRVLGHSITRTFDDKNQGDCYGTELWLFFGLDLIFFFWYVFAYAIYTDMNYSVATNLIERLFGGRAELISKEIAAMTDVMKGHDDDPELPNDPEDETMYGGGSGVSGSFGADEPYLLTSTGTGGGAAKDARKRSKGKKVRKL